VLCLLEERVAGLELCVVSSGREGSKFRTVYCVFWKRVAGLELCVVSSGRR